MIKLFRASFILALFAATSSFAGDWQFLGERQVKLRSEKDVIKVTGNKGTFKKIQLRIRKNGVHMIDLKIHYANGDVQDVGIRKQIPKGGETRVIDLNGRNRVIKKVVMRYKSKVNLKGHALVRLWGKH